MYVSACLFEIVEPVFQMTKKLNLYQCVLSVFLFCFEKIESKNVSVHIGAHLFLKNICKNMCRVCVVVSLLKRFWKHVRQLLTGSVVMWSVVCTTPKIEIKY